MVTVVILTKNEQVHIRRVIENVRGWASAVFVVDSFSDDGTPELAAASGAVVFQHSFEDYAAQREWALRTLPYTTDWMLFLDADELVSDALMREIIDTLSRQPTVDGYFLKRRVYWMGTWLRHGGMYPTWLLRLVRHRHARCSSRSINEHLEVNGQTGRLSHDLLHVELKPLSHWIDKHNRYSTMEAYEQWKGETELRTAFQGRLFGEQLERKRWIRHKIWDPLLPPLLRPFLYFLYVYVVRLGFLDGRAGFVYHILQGFWFWFTTGAKYRLLEETGSESINSREFVAEAVGPVTRLIGTRTHQQANTLLSDE